MRLLFAVVVLALVSTIPVGAGEDAATAVLWSWQLQPLDARPGSEAELVLVARIAPHWVVYSSDLEAGVGPLPAKLRKKPQSAVQLIEGLRSIGASRKQDATWNAEISYFAERAELRQRVKLPRDGSPVEVILSGQACYEADGTCHLLRQDISVSSQVASHSRP